MGPIVSWLLCTNHDDALLDRAIVSCLGQSFEDFELLIIANGVDAEAIGDAIGNRYAYDQRVRVVVTHIYLLNFSLNLGLHLARAPLVARIDSDDVSAPDRLERQVACMVRDPSIAVLGSAYTLIDTAGITHGRVDVPMSNQDIRRSLYYRNPICHPSVMLRRDIVLSLGGYLGGQNAEDYDLWARIALNQEWRFHNLEIPLVAYNSDSVGGGRASRKAYANVAAAQLRNFLVGGGIGWLIGSIITSFKAFILADKS